LILSKDNKYVRPKLHKIYADYLFEKKQFWEAAEEYAYSDEIFEHVCMKFLSANNNLSLMKYLCLVYYLRIGKSIEENKEGISLSRYGTSRNNLIVSETAFSVENFRDFKYLYTARAIII